MEFRILDEGDLPAAKQLWRASFEDPDAFLDYYFPRKIKTGNSLGLFSGGTLTSCLHLIPYTMDIRGKAQETYYVTAAATAEEYRNQGLMARLLKHALSVLQGRGVPFTHLYPFYHPFYEKFGWATYTFMKYGTAAETENGEYAVNRQPDTAGMVRLYRDYTRGFTGHIVRSEEDFGYKLGEIACDERKAAFARRDGVLCAYAIYAVQGNEASCEEAVYDSEGALGALVNYLRTMESAETVEFPLPVAKPYTGADKARPYGMARVADTKKLLTMLDLDCFSIVAEVRDEFAPWNAGVFEARYSDGRGEVARTEKAPQVCLDVRDLIRLVHGAAGILELERNGSTTVLDRKVISALEEILPVQNTFVFETY